MKRLLIRSIRKASVLSSKVLDKGYSFSRKIEDKSTRILDGTDYGLLLNKAEPVEKILYTGLPYITPLHPALPNGGDATITLLLPSLDKKSFYGGTATALYVAGILTTQHPGRKLRIVQTLKSGNPEGLENFFRDANINLSEQDILHVEVTGRRYNLYGYLPIHPDDVFVASAWWDAHLLNSMGLSKKFIYLVQDYEPIFYNNSDLSVLAEATYKNTSFVPLCNTQIMYEFMKGRAYPQFSNYKYYFEPAVSREQSGIGTDNTKSKKKLFVYGRPDVHRNLFYSAIAAVNTAFSSGEMDASDWECYMAGQDNLPDIQFSSGAVIHNLGKMGMNDYIEFSKKIDIAVAPMLAPHPNYPTLEFASIGSMVVTTAYENKTDLSRYSHNIILTEPSIEAMADGIVRASKKSYNTRMKNQKNNHIGSSWETALGQVLREVWKDLD